MKQGFVSQANRHFEVIFTTFILLVVLSLVAFFPVYFRGDDATLLEWVHSHPNVFDAFHLKKGILGQEYRPLRNAIWWLPYQLFGLNPLPYQALITALYGFSLLFFFKTVEAMRDRATAFLALLVYIGAYHFLGYIIFWFSDFVFVLELFFIHLALYLLVGAIRRGSFSAWGFVFFSAALLTKEPSGLIIPVVLIGYLLSTYKELNPRRRYRIIGAVAALTVVSTLYLILTPTVRSRQGMLAAGTIASMLEFFWERWSFYARVLVRSPGYVIMIAAGFSALTAVLPSGYRRLQTLLCLALACLIALALRPFPTVAFTAFFLLSIVGLRQRGLHVPATFWFLVPVSGLMTLSYMTRTYLTEASYGMALLVALMLRRIIDITPVEALRARRKMILGIVIAVIVLAGAVASSRVRAVVEQLRTVSAVRQGFRSCIEYTMGNLDVPGNRLAVIDKGDLEPEIQAALRTWSNEEKTQRMQTMDKKEIEKFIRLMGSKNLSVISLAEIRDQSRVRGKTYLLAMNQYERDLLVGTGLQIELAHKFEGYNSSSYVFRLIDEPTGR